MTIGMQGHAFFLVVSHSWVEQTGASGGYTHAGAGMGVGVGAGVGQLVLYPCPNPYPE